MSCLYLFNPENDLALAHGKAQYTAPPNALRLHNAGAALPLWYCDKDDYVVAPNVDLQWLEKVKELFNIKGNIFTHSDIPQVDACAPWGWSLNTVNQFVRCGVSRDLLPDDTEIGMMRQLSHRKITIEVMHRLSEKFHQLLPPMPLEATTEDEVLEYHRKHGAIYIKSPWSSSGRGVINAALLTEKEMLRRAMGIVHRQGSVMCEKTLAKIKDFAMLFYSNGSVVEYCGLSSFFNEPTGAYAGNIIASQQEIAASFEKYDTDIKLSELSQALTQTLTEIIAPYYRGFLGVDMMIYHDENNHYCVAPCVEVNLRMTMGVVAMLWSNRYLCEDSSGVMRVEYAPQSVAAVNNNIEVVDKKLKSGTISLIPPDNYFSITISVLPHRI